MDKGVVPVIGVSL